ncbi:MAG: CapA family protein, partial [Ruminococcaceae bacterium]|nr:CapA family protein [Oscillospiraceae bacterium]
HPHVLQRAEAVGEGWILYSMGNWSFGGNTAPRDRDTAIAQITVRRDPDGSLHLAPPQFIPCKLSGSDGVNDYQPTPYEPDTPEYERAMGKLDGSWTGADLSIDYSAFH